MEDTRETHTRLILIVSLSHGSEQRRLVLALVNFGPLTTMTLSKEGWSTEGRHLIGSLRYAGSLET